MAIATQWVATVAVPTSSTSVYTSVASTVSSYLRDIVVNNGGTFPCSVSMGTNATSAAAASSFYVPAGGSVVLTQCQVQNASKIWAIGIGGATTVNVGYATNVAYV